MKLKFNSCHLTRFKLIMSMVNSKPWLIYNKRVLD